MQITGQMGGLAQTPVSPTSWSRTDSAAQGGGFCWPSRAGPKEVLEQAHVCPKQQPEPSSWDSSVCGERTLPLSPPDVHALEGGYLFTGRFL